MYQYCFNTRKCCNITSFLYQVWKKICYPDSLKMSEFITVRKRILGQGNVLRSVCLSTRGFLYDVTSCPEWFLFRETPKLRPPRYGKERAVRILLERILIKRSSGWDFTEKNNQPLRKPQLTFISLLAIPIKKFCVFIINE